MFWGDAEAFQEVAERGYLLSRKLVDGGAEHWPAAIDVQVTAADDYRLARKLAAAMADECARKNTAPAIELAPTQEIEKR